MATTEQSTSTYSTTGTINDQGIYQNKTGYGVGGINGIHHANTPGWDNTTVGMASSVFDNLLTQNGIHTNDPNYLGALEPIRTGKFIVKWLKVPAFFDTTAVKYLKFFLENAVRQVSGINASQINSSGSMTFGNNGQQFDFPGQLTEGNKDVTLQTITCTGDGLGKLMRYWMYGITDPITGIHHMYGKDLRFIRPNYSGTLMYIFLGPTCRPGDIEYSCIWHEVWPTSSDGKDKFNSNEIGSDTAIDTQEVTLSGIFQDGPECNILAKYIVAGTGLAGQSYFDQMLPAYMYDTYISKIASTASDDEKTNLEKSLNLTAATRFANNSSIYGTSGENGTGALKTHGDMVTAYGIDASDATNDAVTSISSMKNTIIGESKFASDKFEDGESTTSTTSGSTT